MGYRVEIFEARQQLGGMINLIPEQRLPRSVIQSDVDFLLSLGAIQVHTGAAVEKPADLLSQGFAAVCVTTGLWKPISLSIENETLAIRMVDLLAEPAAYNFEGRVAVIGGGATADDCANMRSAPMPSITSIRGSSQYFFRIRTNAQNSARNRIRTAPSWNRLRYRAATSRKRPVRSLSAGRGPAGRITA